MLAGIKIGKLRFSKEIRTIDYRFENYLGDNHLPSIFPKGTV